MLDSYKYFQLGDLYFIYDVPVVVVGVPDDEDFEGAYLYLETPLYELSGCIHAGYSLIDNWLITENPEILRSVLPIVIYL